eukprot:symbB.v1.2.037728.t1/scaffold5649.1/size36637/3
MCVHEPCRRAKSTARLFVEFEAALTAPLFRKLVRGVSVGMVGEIWDKLMTRERREVAIEQPQPTLLSRVVLHSVYTAAATKQPEKAAEAAELLYFFPPCLQQLRLELEWLGRPRRERKHFKLGLECFRSALGRPSWANYQPPSTLSQTESVHRSWNSHQWTGSTHADAWTSSNDRGALIAAPAI